MFLVFHSNAIELYKKKKTYLQLDVQLVSLII